MGMYDNVRVSAKVIPDQPAYMAGRAYQTKDLDCELNEYEVTDAGRLVLVRDGWRESAAPVPLDDYHGDLRIHMSSVFGGESRVVYVVRFTDGKVSRVTTLERTGPEEVHHGDT